MWKSRFDMSSESEMEIGPGHLDSESILKEIQMLYTERVIGIRDAARSLPLDQAINISVPRQKITVLIVGSHTAAKQKFLDLYFDDPRRGSNISRLIPNDRMDKFYITQGNRRRWLSGETVLDYCPHLQQLRNVPGIKDYLTTEVAERRKKSLVSFILAPESSSSAVVDKSRSQMSKSGSRARAVNSDAVNNNEQLPPKPLNIEKAIEILAEASDLIFIFFDPTGKVPHNVTLKPFSNLWKQHQEKIHLLLAKADPDECSDDTREDALSDLAREVYRTKEARKGGYFPQIYYPDLTTYTKDDDRLWNVIQTATKESVSRALTQLEKDASKVKRKLEERKRRNDKAKAYDNAPFSMYIWVGFFIAGCILMWIYEYEEFMCKLNEINFKSACGELATSKIFVSIMAVVAVIYSFHSLFFEKHMVRLNPQEEDLLDKRLAFANYALEQKHLIEENLKNASASKFDPSACTSKCSF